MTRVATVVVALLLVTLLAANQFVAHHTRYMSDDQHLFIYFGEQIRDGATLYVDLWDNKPPVIFWLAAAASGAGSVGLVAATTLALVAATAALWSMARNHSGASTTAAATVAWGAIFWLHPDFLGGAFRTETFVIAFEAIAAACYWGSRRANARTAAVLLLVAGSCVGLAALTKQIGLAVGIAIVIHLGFLAVMRASERRRLLRRVLLFGVGAAAPLVCVWLTLASQGALREAWRAVVTFNRAYAEDGDSGVGSLGFNLYQLLTNAFALAPLVLLAAIGGLLLLAPRRDTRAARPRFCARKLSLLVFLTVWLAVALLGAALGPLRSVQYLLPVIPPLVALSGSAWAALFGTTRLAERFASSPSAATGLVLLVGVALSPMSDLLTQTRTLWVKHDGTLSTRGVALAPTAGERVGERIRALTNPTDRIQCIGYLPAAYRAAQRSNACRFATTEKIAQVGEQTPWIAAELRTTLTTAPPALIFGRLDSVAPFLVELGLPDVWLTEHYQRLDVVEGVELWRRRE